MTILIVITSIYVVSFIGVILFVAAATHKATKEAHERLWELEKQVATATKLEDITYRPAKDEEEISRQRYRRR